MKGYLKREKNNKGMEIEDSFLTASEPETGRVEAPLERRRVELLWLAIVVMLVVLVGRVAYLTIIKGDYYQEVAEENRIRSLVLKAPRGKIYDRNGKILVYNVPSVDAVIIPADLPENSSERKNIADRIAGIIKINPGDAWGLIENSKGKTLKSVLLKQNLSHEESLIFMENKKELPGIEIEKNAIRDYPDSAIFSHILGYEGKIKKEELTDNEDYLLTDYIGKQGIEKSYEKYLRGVHGARRAEVDSLGDVKKELGVINPKPGKNLILNIDSELQKKIFDELSNILEKTQTRTAAAVAINPQNGELLALVSLPSFDNNLFAKGITANDYGKLINDPANPLFNRAIAGEYPPGSTIKPVVALAALEEGTINEQTSIFDPGAINIGSYAFRDWKAHGTVDVRKAIAESCDVFFYSIGGGFNGIAGLGMDRMKKYENMFGLGEATGIDIPGEENGFIPDEQWKLDKLKERWFVGNSFHASIGQGYVTATPLQLANYIAAIANGGTLYQPHIVSSISEENGEKINLPAKIIKGEAVSAKNMQIVKEGMRQTVEAGTAQTLKDLPVAVAGKTGTAQFGSENKTHAWFVSFAPYDNPQIAMVVLVEGGGEGHSSAVPVTKEVYKWYFNR